MVVDLRNTGTRLTASESHVEDQSVELRVTNNELQASRVAQWSKALHHSASCATRHPGSSPGSIAVGPRPKDPCGGAQLAQRRPGLGEGLAGRDVLVPSRTSDSCGGPGAMQTDTVASCTVFPPTHWCGWLSG